MNTKGSRGTDRTGWGTRIVAMGLGALLAGGCGNDKGGGASQTQTGSVEAMISAETGGTIASGDGAFSIYFAPFSLWGDALVTVATLSPPTDTVGSVYRVSLSDGLSFDTATVSLRPPDGAGACNVGWSADPSVLPFVALGSVTAGGVVTATASESGSFTLLPVEGPAPDCACDATAGTCDAGCESCDPDCGATVDPSECPDPVYPGKGTPIVAQVCDWLGVFEQGVADAGKYAFLCDSAQESLSELAAAFPDDVDIKCLAKDANRGLASFVLDDTAVPFGVAYLWVDDTFASRLTAWDHLISLASCGLPHPQTLTMALEDGWHDWKAEAFGKEACTLYFNQSNVICGDDFDPEASLAVRWEGSFYVGTGGCQLVTIKEADRTATGGTPSGGCVVEGLLYIDSAEAAASAKSKCEVSENVIIVVDGAATVDLSKLKHIGGKLRIESASKVILADDLIVDGNVEIAGGEDSVTEITVTGLVHASKDVDINHNKVKSVTFEDLETVGGMVYAHSSSLETLKLPSLVEAQGTDQNNALFITSAGSLKTLEVPKLETLGASLRIDGVVAPVTLTFPALKSVGRYLIVELNEGLAKVELPALETVQYLVRVERNDILKAVLLPALKTSGDGTDFNALNFKDNDLIEEILLPALETTDGAIRLSNNPALKTAAFPALSSTSGFISVLYDKALQTLDLSALGSLKTLEVKDTALDQCVLNTLVEKLGADCDCYQNAGGCEAQ